jgi:hypothetical protein
MEVRPQLLLHDFEVVDKNTRRHLPFKFVIRDPGNVLLKGSANDDTYEFDDVPVSVDVLSATIIYERTSESGLLATWVVSTENAQYKLINPSAGYAPLFLPHSLIVEAVDFCFASISRGDDTSLAQLLVKVKRLSADVDQEPEWHGILQKVDEELSWLIIELEEPFRSRLRTCSIISDLKAYFEHSPPVPQTSRHPSPGHRIVHADSGPAPSSTLESGAI